MNHCLDSSILPECYMDTNLIETLVPSQHGYNHQKGCPAVAKKMKEHFSERFAVGIMDKDKKRVSYLKEFSHIAHDEAIELFKHHRRPHYILLISPAVEGFILAAVSELSIDLCEYDIPDNLDDMRKETKQVDAKSSQKYRKLFKRMKSASEFQKLTRIISYLKEANYNAQEDVLKSMLEKGKYKL